MAPFGGISDNDFFRTQSQENYYEQRFDKILKENHCLQRELQITRRDLDIKKIGEERENKEIISHYIKKSIVSSK